MAKSTKAPKLKPSKPKATKLKAADAPRKKKGRVAANPDVSAHVLDRLWSVVLSRKNADPTVSHSARLLSRGPAKVAQKFGEEAVECVIEAVLGNNDAVIAESADVLYHLLVVWVASGVSPHDVWEELHRREGISGIAEKAARPSIAKVARKLQTTKIP